MEITYLYKDIQKFFDFLDRATALKTVRLVQLLSVREYHLTMPYSKKIGKNLYELRVVNTQNVRVFYTFHQEKIVLLHAVYKKTQKLKKRTLEIVGQRLRNLQLR
ncbi:MAG: type II toxin-antitoxin system RelE/ParE family toxin [Candidatus Paceibacterota bacterium]|jgi:phage-related protein